MAFAVTHKVTLARAAGQYVVTVQLHAFNTGIIHASETDDMRRHFCRRVEAFVFLLTEYAGHFHRHHLFCHIGRHSPFDIHKFFFLFLQLLLQFLGWHFQQLGHLL